MEAVIPAEMVEEILVRLRVKSLSRFKCVCRSWRALIESRRFIHRHYNHDSNQERLVFRSGEFVEDRFEKSYGGDRRLLLSYFGEGTTNRMGAVNGFVCEVSASGDIVLLNPATHEVKRVPPLLFVPMHKLCFGFGFGFGFDPSSGAYKIVVFEREGAKAAWVYNSSSDCWKRGEVVGVGSWVMKTAGWWRRVAFSNGVYYWMIEYNYVGKHILAFDMTSEKFREIKVPDEVLCVSNIAAYGDSIALMDVGCHLWVMRKQGVWSNRWAFSDAAGLLLVCMWKDEVLFWSNRDEEFILVNISTREITSVEAEEPFLYPAPFCYKESLVSIKGEKDA